jgi:hypothetical protein
MSDLPGNEDPPDCVWEDIDPLSYDPSHPRLDADLPTPLQPASPLRQDASEVILARRGIDNPRENTKSLKLEQRGLYAHDQGDPWRDTAVPDQFSLWSAQTIHKNTVAAKLRGIGMDEQAATLEKCHTIYTFAVCTNCNRHQKFPNRCDRFYCPECAPRRSHDRERAVMWWATRITQPKHVVLTLRNVPDLTQGHVEQLKKWFRNLRRQAFAKHWKGGCYSIEVTNEGRGWHLHLHALIDAVWIDEFALSSAWEKTTNGMGRIVRVRSAHGPSYLRQVTKYLVKGNQLAAWAPETIATFIKSFEGHKTFGVFGSLHGARTEFATFWKSVRDQKPKCSCGCSTLLYFSEVAWAVRDFQANTSPEAARPPPGHFEPFLPEFARATMPK